MKVEVKNKPWKHFIFDNIFSEEDYQTLKDFPRLQSGYKHITGFRDAIDNRVFLNDEFVSKNPQFKSVLRTLNDTESFEKIFDVNLTNCSPRPELIDDRYPFFHEVHCDHPDKVLTMLIYIDKDDEQNLASDLYIDKNTHHTKLKWKDNGGIGWTIEPNDDKWHGFKPMEYKGIRRILIINWVRNEVWRDDSQLYKDFRNRPLLFNPKQWNKLNDLDRNAKYDTYMDWLGGLNSMDDYTDNVNSLKPNDEDNLYKKLKAYILLCRRYRDDKKVLSYKKSISKVDLQNHLNDLQKLVQDNFNEIIKNLSMTKWIYSILMCYLDLGNEEQKFYAKTLVLTLHLDRINFFRGRTFTTFDELTLRTQYDKIKNSTNIETLMKSLSSVPADAYHYFIRYKKDILKILEETR